MGSIPQFHSKVNNTGQYRKAFLKMPPVDADDPIATTGKFKITIEPILFSLFITGALSDAVITKLLITRACSYDIGLPALNCTGNLDSDVESRAQVVVSRIGIFKTLIETLVPAVLSLFIGPWSDTNGRKTFLISPVTGHCLTYCIWGMLSLIPNLNPRMFLISSLPIAISGGLVGVLVSSFCYLNDITNNDNRAFRMEIGEVTMNCGQLLGFLLSPYIFNLSVSYGFLYIFSVNAIILAMTIFYTYFFLPETINTNQFERRKLLNFGHLKDTFRTVTQYRENYGRSTIFIYCAVSALSIIVIEGEFAIRFLAARVKFNWELHDYTTFSTLNLLITAVMSFLGLWILNRVLKIENAILTSTVMLTRTVSSILMAVSTTTIFFYIAANVGCLRSMVGPLVRAQLSTLVTQVEIGKVYSFCSTVEAITPQVSSPLYNTVYSYIVSSYPMAIYFLSAAICLLSAILLLIVRVMRKRNQE